MDLSVTRVSKSALCCVEFGMIHYLSQQKMQKLTWLYLRVEDIPYIGVTWLHTGYTGEQAESKVAWKCW